MAVNEGSWLRDGLCVLRNGKVLASMDLPTVPQLGLTDMGPVDALEHKLIEIEPSCKAAPLYPKKRCNPKRIAAL